MSRLQSSKGNAHDRLIRVLPLASTLFSYLLYAWPRERASQSGAKLGMGVSGSIGRGTSLEVFGSARPFCLMVRIGRLWGGDVRRQLAAAR